MFLALVLASFYFILFYLFTHRIPNRALLIFAIILAPLNYFFNALIHLLTAVALLALTPPLLVLGIGAGDIKLLLLLAPFYLPFNTNMLRDFLPAFSFAALATLILESCLRRSLAKNIALAPAICMVVIWCAR